MMHRRRLLAFAILQSGTRAAQRPRRKRRSAKVVLLTALSLVVSALALDIVQPRAVSALVAAKPSPVALPVPAAVPAPAAVTPTEFTPGVVGTLNAVAGASSVDGVLATSTVVGAVDLSSSGTTTLIVQPASVRQLASGSVSTLQASVAGTCAVASSRLGTFSSAVTAGALGTIVASSCGLFKIAPGPTAFGPALPTGVAQHVASDGTTVAVAVYNSTTNATTLLILINNAWTTAASLTGRVVDLALSTDSVWAASSTTITRVLRSTNTASTFATMSDLGAVTSITVDASAVWTGSGNRIVRIDIATGARRFVAGVLESGLVDGVGVVGRLAGPTAMAWAGGRLLFLNGGNRLRAVDPAFAPVRAPDASFDKAITTDFPTVTTIATGAMGGVAATGGSVAFTSANGLELLNTTTLARTVLVPAGTLCQAVFGTPYYLGSIATDGQSFFVATSCGIKRVNAVSGLVSTVTSVSYPFLVFNEDGYLYATNNLIVRIDPDLGSVTPVSGTPAPPTGLVASDHEQLWTVSDGIYRYDKAAGTSTRVTAPTNYNGQKDLIRYTWLTRAGTALFVVRGSGVARFDTDRSAVTAIRGLVGNGVPRDTASIGPPKTPVPTAVFGGDVTFVAPNALASDGKDLWVTDSNGLHRLQSALPPTMSVLPQYQVDLNLVGMNARTLLVTPNSFASHTWSNGLFVGGKLYMRDSSYNTSSYDSVNTIDTTTGQMAGAFGAYVNIGGAGVSSMTSDGRSIYFSHWQASAQAGDFRRIEKFTPSSGALALVSEFDSQANALSPVVWASPNRLIAVAMPPLAATNWELWSVDPMTGDHVTLFIPPATEAVPNFKSDGTSLWWATGTAVKRMPLTGGPIDTYPVTIPTKVATSGDLRFWNGSITSIEGGIELAGSTVVLGVSGGYGVSPNSPTKTGLSLASFKGPGFRQSDGTGAWVAVVAV